MKSKYNKKANGTYNILFGTLFAVWLLLLIYFFEVYKALHSFYKFVFIEPTQNAIVLSYFVIIVNIIMLFFLYNTVVIKKKSIKNLSKLNKIKIIFCIIATLFISVFGFFSYNYISDDSLNQYKRNLILTEQVFDVKDVNKINIAVSSIAHSSPKGIRSLEYGVLCTVISQDKEYLLESNSFKDYAAMYRYIAEFNDVKICVNKEGFDQLCTYEKEKFFTTKDKSTNNVMYLEKIFNLGDSE